jgi:hypothetical protein
MLATQRQGTGELIEPGPQPQGQFFARERSA